MTELRAPQPSAEQASRIIAADIRAYPKDGPNKREEHLRLYSALLSREVIEAAWAQRYAEIAKPAPFRRRWPPPQSSFSLPALQPTAEEKPKDTPKTTLSVPVEGQRADGAVEVLDPSNPLAVAKRASLPFAASTTAHV